MCVRERDMEKDIQFKCLSGQAISDKRKARTKTKYTQQKQTESERENEKGEKRLHHSINRTSHRPYLVSAICVHDYPVRLSSVNTHIDINTTHFRKECSVADKDRVCVVRNS